MAALSTEIGGILDGLTANLEINADGLKQSVIEINKKIAAAYKAQYPDKDFSGKLPQQRLNSPSIDSFLTKLIDNNNLINTQTSDLTSYIKAFAESQNSNREDLSKDLSQIIGLANLPPPQKDWPEQGGKAYFPIGATYYNAKLATHPKKDWVVVGYSNTDVIEIYKEGHLKQRVRGPEQVEYEQAIVEEVKGIYTSTTSEKTQFTYLYLQAHGDYIFAAYQGKDSEQILHLHVFDWDGKPVKRLAFDQEVSAFWAEETSKNVFQAYVVDGEEGMLNKIELKIEQYNVLISNISGGPK